MSDMNLSAMMNLDTSTMSSGLQNMQSKMSGTIATLAGMAGVGLSLAGVFSGIKQALDMGGQLSDLSARTGIAAGELTILRQAFTDTGVGADAGISGIALMQKALSGMNDSGQPTNKMFEQLGLNLEDLKKLSTTDQLKAMGSSIMQLQSPAERTAAAMGIFGRSGASMLQFFSDPAAINTAKNSLGELPNIMQRNAALFDNISDSLGRIKNKGSGFFAGMAEGLAPALKSLTDSIDAVDFSKWGQQIGEFIATAMQLFKDGTLGEVLKLSLIIGIKDAGNFLVGTIGSVTFWQGVGQIVLGAFQGIGAGILQVFMTPITYLQASMDKVVDELFASLAKVPGLSKIMGLENYGPAKSLSQHLAANENGDFFLKSAQKASAEASGKNIYEGGQKIKSTGSANVFATWDEAVTRDLLISEAQKKTGKVKKDLQDSMNKSPVPPGFGSLQASTGAGGKSGFDVAGDKWAKLGLFVGGGGPALDYAKRTAKATEHMAKWFEKLGNTNTNISSMNWSAS